MTGVRLSAEVVQALEAVAKAENKSRAALIREWVVEELRERGYLK